VSLQDAAPLAAIDVTKTFVVDPVLRGVSLRVEAGRMVVSAGDSGVVELVEFYGHDTVYAVRLDAGAALTVRAAQAPTHARGDRVAVTYTGPPRHRLPPCLTTPFWYQPSPLGRALLIPER